LIVGLRGQSILLEISDSTVRTAALLKGSRVLGLTKSSSLGSLLLGIPFPHLGIVPRTPLRVVFPPQILRMVSSTTILRIA
jgi:hypothetical protein